VELTHKFFITACTKCGFCDGLATGHVVDYKDTCKKAAQLDSFLEICPGIGINRSKYKLNFKHEHPLIGPYVNVSVGYSNNEKQRRSSSSGGILTEILCFLLEQKIVDAVCLPLPVDSTETLHEYSLSSDIGAIREAAQSIYTKVPAWGLIEKIRNFDGNVAFAGLPDQVSSIRAYQSRDKQLKDKIKFTIGPMVGIAMDYQIIDILPALAKKKNSEIKRLRWRYGEWPGYLRVEYDDGILEIPKFHYNYLLPFYCSHESLLSDNFSNESADIAVGDAWSPKYEQMGKGWGIVWAKTDEGANLLDLMSTKGLINLTTIKVDEAVRMHEHMLDFKKRGSKYRAKIYSFFGYPVPEYYSPEPKYVFSRYVIEIIIVCVIWLCRTKPARWALPHINQRVMGVLFSTLRLRWKQITKVLKRKGLNEYGK
jgi:coenzyme F420 hydrogenase subunit beta